ncbi:MAG TPA: GNAT family N-acetyltransferase [Flavobacterium sp.]|nr:GNAT family N-acetyltransferase [Flavobacterium sp.]
MEVSYRIANAADLQLFFNWTNDVEVRNNSYNSQPISLEEHTNWFLSKVNDGKTIFYIAEVKNQPAGMVRFDIKEENAVVSISVDKDFRGMGLASILLKDCCESYFKIESKPVLAYIKSTNTASIHSFQKAHFSFLRNEIFQGIESQVYIKYKDNDE